MVHNITVISLHPPKKLLMSLLLLLVVGLLAAEETFNWKEIRSLLDRDAAGGTLTHDESRLLAAARQERARLMAAGRWPPPALADADRRSTPASGLLQGERTGLVPITDGGPAPGLYGMAGTSRMIGCGS